MPGPPIREGGALHNLEAVRTLDDVFSEQQDKIRSVMDGWLAKQQEIQQANMLEQQQLVTALRDAHCEMLRQIFRSAVVTLANAPVASPGPEIEMPTLESSIKVPERSSGEMEAKTEKSPDIDKSSLRRTVAESKLADKGTSPAELGKKVANRMNNIESDEQVMNAWRRSSGMHTVAKWVKNYRKHPAGWGALLTVHGVPEVTGRLRSKVDNYAIYSALFLSMSIAVVMDPPDGLTKLRETDFWALQIPVAWRCRIYAYSLLFGTASHMVSILLAMSFNNALNEAARDSDVFRMFSLGKGFLATKRCEQAFKVGCLADFLAVATAASCYTSYVEMLVLGLLIVVPSLVVVRKTGGLLMSSVSIVKYWRQDKGGKPAPDDPYDLSIPMACFDERVQTNTELFQHPDGAFCEDADTVKALWEALRERGDDQDMVPEVNTGTSSKAEGLSSASNFVGAIY